MLSLEKLKSWVKRHLKVYRRLELVEGSNLYLRQEAIQLKDQLINRRHTIADLNENILNTVNDLNLLHEKHVKATKHVSELAKRRNEFLNRLSIAVPLANNFPEYKYWLSEPFIVDKYDKFTEDKDAVDEISALKGLTEILDKVDKK